MGMEMVSAMMHLLQAANKQEGATKPGKWGIVEKLAMMMGVVMRRESSHLRSGLRPRLLERIEIPYS